MTRTLVAIVGCHRSGTSATAGALAHLGIHLGPELMSPSSDNPRGYWESVPVVQAHERLLQRMGLTWATTALPKLDQLQWVAALARTELLQVVAQCRGEVFALKDPRMCLFPELWLEVAKLAGVRLAPLFVYRDPEAIARSIRKRDCFGPGRAQEIVRAHLAGIRLWMDRVGQGYTIVYERLLQEPAIELGRAMGTLGVAGDVSAEQLKAVQSFLDPELCHHG